MVLAKSPFHDNRLLINPIIITLHQADPTSDPKTRNSVPNSQFMMTTKVSNNVNCSKTFIDG